MKQMWVVDNNEEDLSEEVKKELEELFQSSEYGNNSFMTYSPGDFNWEENPNAYPALDQFLEEKHPEIVEFLLTFWW